MIETDIVVVGLGAMGSASLYSLSQTGQRVIGIDRFAPPHRLGSSHGKSRIYRQAYFEDPRYIPLAKRALVLWRAIEEEAQTTLLHLCGLLALGLPEETIIKAMLTNAAQFGVPCKTFSQSELRTIYPQFQMPESFVGVLEETAGYVLLEETITALLTLAKARGAQVATNEQVLSWSVDAGGCEVVTKSKRYRCQELVLCPGPWTSNLLADLKLPLRVTRAPQFWFKGQAQHDVNAGMPCFAFVEGDSFVYGFPALPNGLGLKVAEYRPSLAVEDPLGVDKQYLTEELAPIAARIERFLPGVATSPKLSELCFYTLTPDEHFMIGTHPVHKNVTVASCGSGHAFKFIPMIGEAVKHLVEKKPYELETRFLGFRTFN